jgi:heavy metal sensor kinase
MNFKSIKTKLILWYLLVQTLILFSFNYALFINVKQDVGENIYATLKTVAIEIKEDIEKEKLDYPSLDMDKKEKEFYINPLFLRIVTIDAQGTISVMHTTDTKFAPPVSAKAFQHSTMQSALFNNYGDMYMVTIPLNETKILQLSTMNKEATAAIDNFLYTLFILNPFILILSSIGGYFLINKYFSPLQNMLFSINTITASDLSSRLETDKNNDEIGALSRAFNTMLERLESSFNQISQFISDASHELKTPLTVLRGEMEIALRHKRSEAEYQAILKNNLEEVIKIQAMIENLLFLSEASNITVQRDFILCYLDEILSESIKEIQKIALLKNIALCIEAIEPYECKANATLLKIACNNLLKNAVDYSNPDTNILISLHTSTQGAILKIIDHGSGMSSEDMQHIFDRFYRADKSRTRNEGGSGLGLAITKTILDLHKATIDYNSELGYGTTVTVTFFTINTKE